MGEEVSGKGREEEGAKRIGLNDENVCVFGRRRRRPRRVVAAAAATAGGRLLFGGRRTRRRRRRRRFRVGRFRIFRYEIRVWLGGHIPDVAEAVDSPRRLAVDEASARRVLDLVAQVPTPVWGRDELGTGEMWNSNSVIAWITARSELDADSIQPPPGGRAPGWQAGLTVVHRP